MKKFAVVLSGCGVYDGAEIHESVMSLYAIAKNGGSYEIFAPNINQHHVVNHLTGDEMQETRNVLVESARIARGKIKDLKELKIEDFDAVMLPGGFGAAKNLSSFAFDGPNCTVNPDLEKVIKAAKNASKPIGALCITPAVIAKILGNVTVTIGQDEGTANAIEAMGGKHENKSHGEITIDKENKLVTNPCYMLDASVMNIADGANNVVKALMDLI